MLEIFSLRLGTVLGELSAIWLVVQVRVSRHRVPAASGGDGNLTRLGQFWLDVAMVDNRDRLVAPLSVGAL